MVTQLKGGSGYGPATPYTAGRKRKKSALGSWLTTGAILAAVVVAGALGWELLMQDRNVVEILPIADQEISQGAKLRMRVPLHLVGYSPSQLSYSLIGGPPGAVLDSKTGEFTWSPAEAGTFPMTVKVVASGAKPRSDQCKFTIKVRAVAKQVEEVKPPPEVVKTVEENPFEIPGEITPKCRIDELVFGKLKELKIPPANLCSDGVFVRRVFLDVIGTLPTAQEAKDFLADKSPDKRSKLIEQVLQRPEFADYWAMKWSDLLRVKAEFPINLWPNAAQAYHHWLRSAIRDNMPYDKFVRELLTASGSNFRTPQVNFFRALQKKDPEHIVQAVALAFMGARTEKWPTDKIAGMATFFSKVGYKATGEWKEEIVQYDPRKSTKPASSAAAPPKPDGAKPKPKSAVAAPAPLAAQALAMFPDGTRAKLPPDKDPREVFADWLISPDNPWFTRHIVNRVWYWLVGRGIVHEPDDIRPDNPAQNPELLNYLGQELVKSRYDLRQIYRLILNSQAYQLSSISRSKSPEAEANFSFYVPRRLEAEIIIDAICQITGTSEFYSSVTPEPYTYIPENMRSMLLPDGSITSAFLEIFGRPARDSGLESERNNKVSAGQRLHLLNSTHIREKIEKGPKITDLLQSSGDGRQMAETLYLTILSRLPTNDELDVAQGYCSSREGSRVIVWALINSEEFLFRH